MMVNFLASINIIVNIDIYRTRLKRQSRGSVEDHIGRGTDRSTECRLGLWRRNSTILISGIVHLILKYPQMHITIFILSNTMNTCNSYSFCAMLDSLTKTNLVHNITHIFIVTTYFIYFPLSFVSLLKCDFNNVKPSHIHSLCMSCYDFLRTDTMHNLNTNTAFHMVKHLTSLPDFGN